MWLITLPFRMIYWFFKAIIELIELLSGHHRGHRKPKAPAMRRQLKAVRLKNEQDDRALVELYEKCVALARDPNVSAEIRANAYETTLRSVDKMIGRNIDKSKVGELRNLKSSLRREYASFVTSKNPNEG
jgi:hypothetical protein